MFEMTSDVYLYYLFFVEAKFECCFRVFLRDKRIFEAKTTCLKNNMFDMTCLKTNYAGDDRRQEISTTPTTDEMFDMTSDF